MQVTVKLNGLLRPYHPGPNRSVPLTVDIDPDATPASVAQALKLPSDLVRMVFVNEAQAALDKVLNDGDHLAYFTVLVGGAPAAGKNKNGRQCRP
jgi:hypothetical protein